MWPKRSVDRQNSGSPASAGGLKGATSLRVINNEEARLRRMRLAEDNRLVVRRTIQPETIVVSDQMWKYVQGRRFCRKLACPPTRLHCYGKCLTSDDVSTTEAYRTVGANNHCRCLGWHCWWILSLHAQEGN